MSYMHQATHIQLSYCSSHWSTPTRQTQSDVPVALQKFVAPLSSSLTVGGRLIKQDTNTGFWTLALPGSQSLCHGAFTYSKAPGRLLLPFPLGCARRSKWCSMVLRHTSGEGHINTLGDSAHSVVTTTSAHSTFTHLRFTPMLIRMLINRVWVVSK